MKVIFTCGGTAGHVNPAVALVMGFTFSFAWTPCVGPTLSSVLLMASSAESSAAGFLLIGVYTLGFVLPFLAVGLFTGTVLDFFKSHQNVVRYTVKIGAVLLIDAFLKENGIPGIEPLHIGLWAIPTAIAALIIHMTRLLRLDARIRRDVMAWRAEQGTREAAQ